MNNETLLAGKWEMSVGKVLFPAELLGDITINYSEGTLEADTQAGTRKQPSGKTEDAEITFTLFLSSLEYVKKAFDIADTDPMIFGGGKKCSTRTPRPIHIHQLCAGNDAKNDFHVYAGLVETKFNPTLSTGDAAQIELTIQMQPAAEGRLLLGYPDPETPQYWDAEAQDWKAVEE